MRNLQFAYARISIPTLLVTVGLMMGYSCKQPDTVSQEGLYGRWDIAKAERNGKETHYLRNGYFIINQDGTMTINITGEDETGKYIIERNKLIMSDDRTFDIQSFRNDSMNISYEVNSDSKFIFYMTRKNEDAQ